jgi:serine protease Do
MARTIDKVIAISAVMLLAVLMAVAPAACAGETADMAESALPLLENVIVKAYESNKESVVNIVSREFVYSFWEGVVPRDGQGSGFIIDSSGYILTNYHVVKDAQTIEVTLTGEEKLDGVVVGQDPSSDLAVLKVSPSESLKAVTLGSSGDLRVGQMVIAIGNPFGLERTVTMGVISSLDRQLSTETGEVMENVIQTDASINPGNSGGPLLNLKGEVIGINTAIFSLSGGNQGIGFAIPIDKTKEITRQLIKYGRVLRPWLGIGDGYVITPKLTRILELPVQQGILVTDIISNSPADKAGIRGASERVRMSRQIAIDVGGDVIIEIAGQKITSGKDLRKIIRRQKIGDKVAITIYRGKKKMVLEVVLEEGPY